MGLTGAILLYFLQTLQSAPDADWKARGIEDLSRHRMDAAVASFEKACELSPGDEDSCYYLARTLFSLDRWEKAREPFAKALRAASGSRRARVHRAIALNYMALGEMETAEAHFRQAIALNPGAEVLQEDPRIDYGAFLFRQGRLEEALPVLRKAAESLPRSARAHLELGRVVLHMGNPELAAASLERAVDLDPRSSTARLLLGRAYMQSGKIDEGRRQLHLARDAGSSTVR